MNSKNKTLKPLSPVTLEKLGNSQETKEILQRLLNQFAHRISDTEITSRNANYLEKAGLMPPHNQNISATKWRSFNTIDMLYINALLAVKRFGVKNENLLGLKRLFYNNTDVEHIIIALCLNVEITLVFYPSGECYLLDDVNLAKHILHYVDKKQPYILLSLTEILRNGRYDEPVNYISADYIREMVQNALAHFAFTQLSPNKQEAKVLEILKGQSFDSLQIFKKNGKLDRVVIAKDKDFSLEEIRSTIKEKDYGTIVIRQANGGVVQFRNEECIKLN